MNLADLQWLQLKKSDYLMDISIIIPTKDRGVFFDEALQSVVKAIEGLDAEVIVINDSKTSNPNIPSGFQNIRLIHNPKNGVASARNLGASLAQAELILFMDDDFVIPHNCIKRAFDIVKQDESKIHLFNWVYPPKLQKRLKQFQFGRYLIAYQFTSIQGWLGDEWRDEEVFELKDGASYFLPIMKSMFLKIGGYNEDFTHAGAEDYDFVQRAKGKGVKFFLDKTCTLYHNEGDRIYLENWLKRKERNGETIKMAVDIGYQKLAIYYSPFKKLVLRTLSNIRLLISALLKFIPNIPIFDWFYFGLVNLLLAIYIFKGYEKKER